LILNGLFLSFVVSPFLLKKEKEGKDGELLPQSLQNKIIVSFIISALFWWSSLFLLVVYILES
jgi:predicted cobalt transporter CbtA